MLSWNKHFNKTKYECCISRYRTGLGHLAIIQSLPRAMGPDPEAHTHNRLVSRSEVLTSSLYVIILAGT